MKHWLAVAFSFAVLSCANNNQPLILPIALSNNAVALLGDTAYSFAGLRAGKTWADVTSHAFACDLDVRKCRQIPGLPDGVGRLASAAVTIGDKVLIFGGYSVAKDGFERSTPQVWAFDPVTQTYAAMAAMPVPVDDALALGFADRYVFLISGWHDTDNVNLVQVLDVQENRWFSASAFPDDAVFGHAGGIVGNVFVVCGGVKVVPPKTKDTRRTFESTPACLRGEIDVGNLAKITWSAASPFAGAGYRMAAVGHNGAIWFAGGSDNPYNYNGIGYDGVPSQPSKNLWRYDIGTGKFSKQQDKALASMDHRGMLLWHDQFVILGGIGEGQKVMDKVQIFGIPL